MNIQSRFTERKFAGRVIGQVFLQQVSKCASKDFVRFEGEAMSYGEAGETVRAIATGLRNSGVMRGDRVAVLSGNRPEWIMVWLATALLGAIEVGVNNQYRGQKLAQLLKLVRPKCVVVSSEYLPILADVRDDCPSIELVVNFDAPVEGPLSTATSTYADLRASTPIDINGLPDVAPTDSAKLVFTSGTSGPAKAVALSHGYCIDFSTEWVRHLRYQPEDVHYTCFPLFHASAALETVLAAVLLGATIGLGRRFSASGFWSDVRQAGGTVMTCLGAAMAILERQPRSPSDSDNPVRQILAAPRPAKLQEFERRFDVKVVECYGATEFGHPAFSPIDDVRDGYVGRLVGHHDVVIVDERDRPVLSGQVGQILVRPRGPNEIMTEYFGNPAATVAAWRNLWYHTGDLGSLTDDGWLAFHGRVGDRIRVRGHQVSAEEIEQVFAGHPSVAECAAIGVPSDLSDDEVKLVVVAAGTTEINLLALREWAAPQMPEYMLPRFIELSKELPKNDTQKVLKSVLRAQWRTASTIEFPTRRGQSSAAARQTPQPTSVRKGS